MSGARNGPSPASIPRYVFGAIFGVTAVVFVATAIAQGFEAAWNILIAFQSPFGRDRLLSFLLSVLGYLLVPAAIGLAISDSIMRYTGKRVISLPEAQAEIRVTAEQVAEQAVANRLAAAEIVIADERREPDRDA